MAARAQEVAKQFYYSGHTKICDYLTSYLEVATRANLLDIANCQQAACQFLSLMRGDIHLRALFDVDFSPSESSLQEITKLVVEFFIKGYANDHALANNLSPSS